MLHHKIQKQQSNAHTVYTDSTDDNDKPEQRSLQSGIILARSRAANKCWLTAPQTISIYLEQKD